MKIAAIIATVVGVIWGVLLIVYSFYASYQYNNKIYSYWNLSVKASTLSLKSQYLDQFVGALQDAKLSGNDALFFKTPDNSYAENFATLQSLQQRFHEVEAMDPTSFQYSQSIQQITAQEQDGAGDMLEVFRGVWYLNHYPLLWNWVLIIEAVICAYLACGGPIVMMVAFSRKPAIVSG